MPLEKPGCSFSGCKNKQVAHNLCDAHARQLRSGKPLVPLYTAHRDGRQPPVIRYEEVACDVPGLEGPCHVFTTGELRGGYRRISVKSKMVTVHKYVWEQVNGPVPVGLVMDHRCRNRQCINLNHLRAVTRKVNVTENIIGHTWQKNLAKTHCKHGHAFSAENTYVTIGKRSGERMCRTCMRNKDQRQRAKRKHLQTS